jgi:thermostable 8-oxoguanine DNA glycosylase
MIDPRNITKYDRTDDELEELMLFAAAVTAKTATVTAKQLDFFLTDTQIVGSPFQKVQDMISAGTLVAHLKNSKIGQYTRLEKAFTQLIKLNPRTCTVDELEAVHGIGPKTARFFILHSRPNQRIAALDTHMIHFLREKGYTTLDNTPTSSKKYAELEAIFIEEADKAGKTVAEFDLSIWNKYSKHGNTYVKEPKVKKVKK